MANKTQAETALSIQPIHEIEGHEKYVALQNKAEAILTAAKKLQVRSQPTMDDAAEKQVSVKILRKEIKGVKESYVKPINERKGQILTLFKNLDGPLEEADEIIGGKMAGYQKVLEEQERKRQEEQRRKEEEERKRKEQEFLEAQKKVEKAKTEEEIEAANERAAEAQQALEKTYEAPARPTPKIAPKIRRTAGGGSVSFRDVPKYEVVNTSLLPDQYTLRVPDHKKLKAVVDAGVKVIPGVRIWVEKKPWTRAGKF